MAKHLELGKRGEEIAAKYLINKGYRILETNWRHRRAEVDLIAMDGECLVFIEVKTRSSGIWGQPELAVTTKKERLLADASGVYMEQIGHEWTVRFDILAIIIINEHYETINHYQDAFFPGLD